MIQLTGVSRAVKRSRMLHLSCLPSHGEPGADWTPLLNERWTPCFQTLVFGEHCPALLFCFYPNLLYLSCLWWLPPSGFSRAWRWAESGVLKQAGQRSPKTSAEKQWEVQQITEETPANVQRNMTTTEGTTVKVIEQSDSFTFPQNICLRAKHQFIRMIMQIFIKL